MRTMSSENSIEFKALTERLTVKQALQIQEETQLNDLKKHIEHGKSPQEAFEIVNALTYWEGKANEMLAKYGLKNIYGFVAKFRSEKEILVLEHVLKNGHGPATALKFKDEKGHVFGESSPQFQALVGGAHVDTAMRFSNTFQVEAFNLKVPVEIALKFNSPLQIIILRQVLENGHDPETVLDREPWMRTMSSENSIEFKALTERLTVKQALQIQEETQLNDLKKHIEHGKSPQKAFDLVMDQIVKMVEARIAERQLKEQTQNKVVQKDSAESDIKVNIKGAIANDNVELLEQLASDPRYLKELKDDTSSWFNSAVGKLKVGQFFIKNLNYHGSDLESSYHRKFYHFVEHLVSSNSVNSNDKEGHHSSLKALFSRMHFHKDLKEIASTKIVAEVSRLFENELLSSIIHTAKHQTFPIIFTNSYDLMESALGVYNPSTLNKYIAVKFESDKQPSISESLAHEMSHALMHSLFAFGGRPYHSKLFQDDIKGFSKPFNDMKHKFLDNFAVKYFGLTKLDDIKIVLPNYFNLNSYEKGQAIERLEKQSHGMDLTLPLYFLEEYIKNIKNYEMFFRDYTTKKDPNAQENACVHKLMDSFLDVYRPHYSQGVEDIEFIVRYPESVAANCAHFPAVKELLEPVAEFWQEHIAPAMLQYNALHAD